ncbi:SRPBCC family protein [Sphingobacterium oryzagri]|uniref:SRPBCC family protein n=1 Tax=Sphingobacterium oryzagri TaxID=3025669 RepID=A0ABY7WSJ1_9SPHI|nr:SRPBCC family protein [Sphingobacterium sp. KACC 22765]WDF70274.1 SRPBCC family protein [Sphingobacterium sp. KACC 22765]
MEPIHIETTIKNNVATVWNAYNSAEDIMQWNHASDDWHCTSSVNDLRVGGKFSNRMEAKDGSFGFDFEGEYTAIEPFKHIAYVLADGRKVAIHFKESRDVTTVSTTFDPETQNPIAMQRDGWQAILTNFKTYVERVYGTGTNE